VPKGRCARVRERIVEEIISGRVETFADIEILEVRVNRSSKQQHRCTILEKGCAVNPAEFAVGELDFANASLKLRDPQTVGACKQPGDDTIVYGLIAWYINIMVKLTDLRKIAKISAGRMAGRRETYNWDAINVAVETSLSPKDRTLKNVMDLQIYGPEGPPSKNQISRKVKLIKRKARRR
jgi:hypothetical protein